MNITRERYEADIRAAKADAWDEGERTALEDLFGEGAYIPGTPNPYRGNA